MINHKIYLAPLQGYTISDYRNLHHQYFGGIDKYFSPYLRFEPNKELKKSVLKDLAPENNKEINFIPQILGKDISMFIDLAKQMESWGYQEMNWNLGCPYPMVTNRGLGSALLQTPEKVKKILDSVFSKITIPLSIKCRLGFDNFEDIHELIEIFNQYPIKELSIHTRSAKQMYKGRANPNAFAPLIKESKHSLVYNGDINNKADILGHDNLFGDRIEAYMIGRGLLKNPFLAAEIKGDAFSIDEKRGRIKAFYSELFHLSKQKLESSHLLGRMTTHWEYLSYLFKNQHKIFKAIKKSKRIDKYQLLIDKVLLSEELL